MPETSCSGQLQDGDATDGWQSLTTHHTDKQWQVEGGGQKLLNAPHKMLLLPVTPISSTTQSTRNLTHAQM